MYVLESEQCNHMYLLAAVVQVAVCELLLVVITFS
jgi:hypothetical protein